MTVQFGLHLVSHLAEVPQVLYIDKLPFAPDKTIVSVQFGLHLVFYFAEVPSSPSHWTRRSCQCSSVCISFFTSRKFRAHLHTRQDDRVSAVRFASRFLPRGSSPSHRTRRSCQCSSVCISFFTSRKFRAHLQTEGAVRFASRFLPRGSSELTFTPDNTIVSAQFGLHLVFYLAEVPSSPSHRTRRSCQCSSVCISFFTSRKFRAHLHTGQDDRVSAVRFASRFLPRGSSELTFTPDKTIVSVQ